MESELRDCKGCGIPFNTEKLQQVFHNKECREEWYQGQYPTNTWGHLTGLNKVAVGTIAELSAALDLTRKGWEVFSALRNASCDLIALKDNRVIRVEVRSAFERNGKIYSPKPKNISKYDLLIRVTPQGIYYTPALKVIEDL